MMKRKDMVKTVALLAAAVICFVLIAPVVSQPGNWKDTFASIDSKADSVLMLAGASAVASTAISAIPDDFGTPIANQVAEYTDYLLIILSILMAEKYLLTILGLIAFRVLIPFALVCAVPFIRRRLPLFRVISAKIAVLGLALFLVIPASMAAADMIYDTYQVSFEETIQAVSLLSSEEEVPDEDEGFLSSMWSTVSSAVTATVDTVTHIPDKVTNIVNHFIQSIAVMIVTSCIIPLAVLLLFLWLAKQITGYPISLPESKRRAPLPRPTVDAEE